MIFLNFENLLENVSTEFGAVSSLCPEETVREKILLCEQNLFFFHSFWDNNVAVLSKLHSECPGQNLDGKIFWKIADVSFFAKLDKNFSKV